MNQRKLAGIYRSGLQRKIRRGIRVSIFPSYRCNYKCEYCSLYFAGDSPDTSKRKPLAEWKDYITNLNRTLRNSGSCLKNIVLTGGEPTILPYFTELCNWILNEGYMLNVYTNLSHPGKLLEIKPSFRLLIHASYHPSQISQEDFMESWYRVDEIHRTIIVELGEKTLPIKKVYVQKYDNEERQLSNHDMLRVDPEYRIFLRCIDNIAANQK